MNSADRELTQSVERRLHESSAERLARFFALDEARVSPWNRRELAQVFEHQLKAPLRLGLVEDGPTMKSAGPVLGAEERLALDTFEKVLFHPRPPVEVLRLIKEFAKAHLVAWPVHLPEEVAGILYYGTIAVGLVKCGERISRLTNQELRFGMNWALAIDWLDPRLKTVLQTALASIPDA